MQQATAKGAVVKGASNKGNTPFKGHKTVFKRHTRKGEKEGREEELVEAVSGTVQAEDKEDEGASFTGRI